MAGETKWWHRFYMAYLIVFRNDEYHRKLIEWAGFDKRYVYIAEIKRRAESAKKIWDTSFDKHDQATASIAHNIYVDVLRLIEENK